MTVTFRELCAEVLAFHHGEGCYNFSGLSPYDRDNAAFDAWQDIRQRLKSALAQPAPAPAVVPVSERPWDQEGWCDERGYCWRFDPCPDGWWSYGRPTNFMGDHDESWTHMAPHNAIALPQGGEGEA